MLAYTQLISFYYMFSGVTHMADDRADPIRDNYNPEAEAHLFGIINGDILYVPAQEDEEEDISSYLNLGGEDEGRQRGDDEGTGTVDGGQPSTNTSGDVDKQLAITTSGEVYIYIEPLVIQIYRFQ
jgi:hypothetical protein